MQRWEGGGYPDGLAGEAIPLEARIISCCDTWNAMRTDRSYRRALSYEVALEEVRSARGTQLDPAIVDVLMDVVAVEAPANLAAEPNLATEPNLAAAPNLAAEPVSPNATGAPPRQPAYG